MSRREPFPPLLIILAFISTGGCRRSSQHQRQTSLRTDCPKQGGHMPSRLCPFPVTLSRLVWLATWHTCPHLSSYFQQVLLAKRCQDFQAFLFAKATRMGHSTKFCRGTGRRMWRTTLGWVHTQTGIHTLWKSTGIQRESCCWQQLRAETTKPASGHNSNGGAKFHRLGRYCSCSETNYSIKAGKDYDKFNGELKWWVFSMSFNHRFHPARNQKGLQDLTQGI